MPPSERERERERETDRQTDRERERERDRLALMWSFGTGLRCSVGSSIDISRLLVGFQYRYSTRGQQSWQRF